MIPALAQASSNSAEKRKWKTCTPDPCQCQGSWSKMGFPTIKFNGCTLPPVGVSDTRVPWCYVEGNCPTARKSTNPMEGRMWRTCDDPCACQDKWLYRDGKGYAGCTLPPTSTDTVPFCYVKDGYNCPMAMNSRTTNDERRWRKCTPTPAAVVQPAQTYTTFVAHATNQVAKAAQDCQCLNSWSKKTWTMNTVPSPTFYGCALPPVGFSGTRVPWCYVSPACTGSAATAAGVMASSVVGETRKWKTCTPDPCQVDNCNTLNDQKLTQLDIPSYV